jgi:hypothetical protein
MTLCFFITVPGATPVPDYNQVKVPDPIPQTPEGFVPLFNGKDLAGWHVSKTARHGRTPDFRVVHGMLLGTQQPYGQGGMLVTDKKYRNFELTLETKPDWGCLAASSFVRPNRAPPIRSPWTGGRNIAIRELPG